MRLTLDLALDLIAAARAKATEIGVPMVIAVVDGGGNLVAQQRMDDALLVSLEIALNKAYTAVAVKLATHELAPLVQPGGPLYGISNADKGRVIVFGEAIPSWRRGKSSGELASAAVRWKRTGSVPRSLSKSWQSLHELRQGWLTGEVPAPAARSSGCRPP